MQIKGFLLGFLLFNPAILGCRAIAQVDSQSQPATAAAIPSVPSDSAASGQDKAQDASPAARNKAKEEDAGSSGHRLHLRLGTISLGAGYSSGPGFYPYGPYDYFPFGWGYSAYWYPFGIPYPFFAPGFFAYGTSKGEVKLTAEPKTAEVYLDGAYAGTADHLKSIWLEPGAYDLSLSAASRETFHQRIYVLSGKSLRIAAKLVPGEATDKTQDKDKL